MKRIYIKFVVCIIIFFLSLFLFEYIKREGIRQKEVRTEKEILYSVSYSEYKEEEWGNFKIFIPKVQDIGNQDLEIAINRELKREAVTWLKDDITFLNGHQPNEPIV